MQGGVAHKWARCMFINFVRDFQIDVTLFVEGWLAIMNNKKDNWETTDSQAFTEWLERKPRIGSGGHLQGAL